MASHFAKKYQGYRHCCMIDSDEKRIKALKLYPIDEVWGIGRRYAAKLNTLGVKTAYDFAQYHKDWVWLTFNNINIVRTWQELNGEDVVPNEELAKKKSICTSRSFNGMIPDIEGLRTHISNYAARCAEKLRQQGYQYKKAGVIVMGIGPDSPIQQDLFDINAEQFQKMRRLDEVRVSIRTIKESVISEDLLLDAFIRSDNSSRRPSVDEWNERWHKMIGTIDGMQLNLPQYDKDRQFIDSVLSVGKYAISHSPEYREAYRPHYRIVERSIFEQEILPLIEQKKKPDVMQQIFIKLQ